MLPCHSLTVKFELFCNLPPDLYDRGSKEGAICLTVLSLQKTGWTKHVTKEPDTRFEDWAIMKSVHRGERST